MAITQTAAQIAALGGGHPVRVADALAAGISRSALRAACDAGALARPAHGFVVPVMEWRDSAAATWTARCRALLSRRPHAVLSHVTAATTLRLPTPGRPATTIHCTDPHPRRLPGVVIHRGAVCSSEIVEVDGLRVTSPLRTAVDVARMSRLPQALITMDAALRLRTLELAGRAAGPDHWRVEHAGAQAEARAELNELVSRCLGRAGAQNARQAMQAASPLSESAAESWSRGHLLLAGIVPLGLQVRVMDAAGHERRLDFLLSPGLAGEVDGMVKYDDATGAQRLRDEKTRDLLLERVDVRTIRWTGVEVFRDPAQVVRMAAEAIALHRATRGRRVG